MKRIFLFVFLSITSSVFLFNVSAQGLQYGNGFGIATGNITTQNLNPLTGTPTAGSFVRLTLANHGTATVHVSGTYTGALSFQYTTNGGTNWVTYTSTAFATLEAAATTAATITSAAVGAWTIDVAGLTDIRVSALAAVTGTAVVTIKAVGAAQQVGINAPLPAGTNAIGSISNTGFALNAGTAAVGYVGLQMPLSVADIASAALTTTTTTAAFTPAFGASYSVNIPVTAVSGTTPTLDVQIQESDDAGTNWFAVYDFPRITATGIYRSPELKLRGTRVRYVQTVSGTSPSFTRSLNRLQISGMPINNLSQMIDRTIAVNTAGSTTPVLNTQNARNVQLSISMGAITTTAPQISLQGSDDDGATWTIIGGLNTAVASSTTSILQANYNYSKMRAIVSVAGSGATLNYILIKAF